MTIEFRCLHGTLQTPEAWDVVAEFLGRYLQGFSPTFHAEDVLEFDPAVAERPSGWARAFCAALPPPPAVTGVAHVLIGYSLGGRLGLHALLECPDRWNAAVIVAGHPGDASTAERVESRRRDAGWAARLREEDLDAVLADWDALPVFCGRPNPAPRQTVGLSAERWASAFERLSRGNQADLRAALAAAPLPPVLYVSGELDSRYGALGDELARTVPSLRHVSIPAAGHRVPWERPEAFADTVAGFLRLNLREAPEGGDE